MPKETKIKLVKVWDNPDNVGDPLVEVYLSDRIDGIANSLETWNTILHDEQSDYPIETWMKIKLKVEDHLDSKKELKQEPWETGPHGSNEAVLRKLQRAEPYRDAEGKIAVIMVDDGTKLSIDEWFRKEPELREAIHNFINGVSWLLPLEPQLGPDPNLRDDIKSFLKEHIWHDDERWFDVFTDWILCSYIPEHLRAASRQIIFGDTHSGKTRTMNTIQSLSYRAIEMLIPTSAVLFRAIELYRPTLCIDEFQDLSPDRSQDIVSIIKSGFNRGSTVWRTAGEDCFLQSFHVFAPVLIGTEELPAIEIQNRSLLCHMNVKPATVNIKKKIDFERATALRTRLLAFRVSCISGALDMKSIAETAESRALDPTRIGNVSFELNDRSIEMATELLIPEVIFNCDGNGIMQLMAESQKLANDDLVNNEPATIFKALVSLCDQLTKNLPPTTSKEDIVKMMRLITTKEVCERYQEILKDQGDNANVSTNHVTSVMKKMGFTFETGPHNASIFEQRTFEKAYKASLKKYTNREY
jgi:hypothetical protein